MFPSRSLVLPALFGSLLVGSLACDSDDHDRNSRHDRVVIRDRDRDYRDRDYRDDDAIIVGDRIGARTPIGVPRSARMIDTARGTTEMAFEARRHSTVYVYDVDADRVVYSGTLRDGDRFVIDPNDNRALINGRKVLDTDLKSKHVFKLYVDDGGDRF